MKRVSNIVDMSCMMNEDDQMPNWVLFDMEHVLLNKLDLGSHIGSWLWWSRWFVCVFVSFSLRNLVKQSTMPWTILKVVSKYDTIDIDPTMRSRGYEAIHPYSQIWCEVYILHCVKTQRSVTLACYQVTMLQELIKIPNSTILHNCHFVIWYRIKIGRYPTSSWFLFSSFSSMATNKS